jgi:propionaldehyde dehydrogenase
MSKQLGVFETPEEAIKAAEVAQKAFVAKSNLAERDKIVANIKKRFLEKAEDIAKLELEETKLGVYEHKVFKIQMTAMGVLGTEHLETKSYASEQGLTIIYGAPYGVIVGVTPVTNPVATVIGNGGCMVVSGNAIVFNAHPSAKRSSAYGVDLINQAIIEAGGPENLITMVKEPTLETLDKMVNSPVVRLLVGTGGPAMVKALMKSGKKVIAAGAGNPPVIVDETADIDTAALEILKTASFDNNLLCLGEKEVFVVDSVADKLIKAFQNVGCGLLTKEEADKVLAVAIPVNDKGEREVNKTLIGKDPAVILEAAGIKKDQKFAMLIFDAQNDSPFVQKEQMMPVLPIVRCKNYEQARDWAVAAEHSCRHSAAIWTKNVDRATEFGRLIDTSIFVQNGNTLSGAGRNGPTIATPTGEGICDANSFTRKRKYAMASGANYIL